MATTDRSRGPLITLMRAVWLGIACVVVFVGGPAYAELTVRAIASSEQVRVGETFTLTIEATGTQALGVPNLGHLEGFQSQYVGPSTRVSIVNGQMNSLVQHRFALTAQREGEFVIGPFSVEHAGSAYATGALRIVVGGAPEAPAADDAGPLRLELIVPRQTVYLHERVPIEIALYVGDVTARDVQYPVLHASGVSIEGFGQPSRATQMVGGQRFEVLRFQTAIVPLQAGERALGPATMNLNVVQQPRSFFAMQRQGVELRSNAVRLEVLPLPAAGRPAAFTGAVGRFVFDVSAAPTQVDAGDPITVRILLRGEGNLSSVSPPVYEDAPGRRVYPPQLVEGSDGNARVYEQVVIVEDPATDRLPPLTFAYFDPTAASYVQLESVPIPLVVRDSGVDAAVVVSGDPTAGADGRRAESLGRDIVYIKDDPGRLTHRDASGRRWWWLLLWQPLPLLFYVGVVLYDRHRRRMNVDERYARATRAGRAVRASLAEVARALDAGDRSRFFDQLESAVRSYLAAKLGLPPGGIEAERLAHAGVDAATVQSIMEILAACEQERFAPASGAAEPRQLLERARAMVADLERRRGFGFR